MLICGGFTTLCHSPAKLMLLSSSTQILGRPSLFNSALWTDLQTFQQIQLSKVEKKYGKSMKVLCANKEGELISLKLKNICNRKDITIKYIASYMYEKNRLIKCGQRTIVIIKNSLLINCGLSLKFWAKTIDTINYF